MVNLIIEGFLSLSHKVVGLFFSDDDEDGVLQLKRTDHDLSDDDEATGPSTAFERKTKVVTKAAIAKKLSKKNIKANRVFVFDDEGLATEAKGENLMKSSAEGKRYEVGEEGEGDDDDVGGIDIDKAKSILLAEDAYDRKKEKERVKQKHKEKKKKEKELKKRQKKDDNEMVCAMNYCFGFILIVYPLKLLGGRLL
jgi:ATP-dependent RNA helicase DDX10/DBP4